MSEFQQQSINAVVNLTINDGENLYKNIKFFKWRLFEGGYVVHARLFDPAYAEVQKIYNEDYLKNARKKPLKIKFGLEYKINGTGELKKIENRIAYVTNLNSYCPPGGQLAGYFEFIAIDPPSWYLNRGDAFGGVYTGKVSQVIRQVVEKYAPGIEVEVSETEDNAANVWHQLRQDPKSFIMSLLDWSSSITNGKTRWVVSSDNEKIIILDQFDQKSEHIGDYSVNSNRPASENVLEWVKLDDNFLMNYQTRLSTGGISAVSGLYCDSTNSNTEKLIIVDDEKTSNKVVLQLAATQGFAKPTELDKGWTFIRSIPEDSAGAVGIQYQNYIDGRSRSLFVGMLDSLSRIRIKIFGEPRIYLNSQVSTSTISLSWHDYQGEPWIANQKWLIHGVEHLYTPDRQWFTNIYCNRKDYNASGIKAS